MELAIAVIAGVILFAIAAVAVRLQFPEEAHSGRETGYMIPFPGNDFERRKAA